MTNSIPDVNHTKNITRHLNISASQDSIFPHLHIRPSIKICSMKITEIQTIVSRWTSLENWNIRKGELAALHAQSPDGFLLLTINQIPVASIYRIQYNDTFSFIGLYIADSNHRGKGYAKYLWDNVVPNIKTPTVGGHAVLAQLTNYQNEGFEPQKLGVFRIKLDPISLLKKCINHINCSSHIKLERMSAFNFEQLLEYDQKISLLARRVFITTLSSQEDTVAFIAKESNEVLGYGIMKKCLQNGYKIAPLYAKNETVLEKLLYAFLRDVDPNESVYLDVPTSRLGSFCIQEILFETVFIYKGHPKKQFSTDQVYGICSMEASPV